MKKKYTVTGMSCAACQARVEGAVSGVPGVEACNVNLLASSLDVVGEFSDEEIKSAVALAGYGISEACDGGELPKKELRAPIIRLVISISLCIVLMFISMGHMVGLPHLFHSYPIVNASIQCAIALAVMIINSRFFISGVRGVLHRAPNMDTLVSMGSFVSFGYSVYLLVKIALSDTAGGQELLHGLYFESAAMILALISLGKLLEAVAKGKTTSAIQGLIDLTPKLVNIIVEGKEITVNVNEIKVGDVFVVRPGERIPCDGVIISGSGSIDESALTGESIPREKSVDDTILAGSVNKSGFITARATATSEGTVLAGVIRMVTDATATKAPIARLADRVSGVFVPAIILISLVTLIAWLAFSEQGIGYAVERGIAVLVISCPCALGLATPVAIMVGGGVGAKHGVLYKNATAIEIAGRVKTVVLDKTGTVTEGKMAVVDVLSWKISRGELLSLALGLEKGSEHPIAEAICEYASKEGIEPLAITDFSTLEGRGVSGKCGENAVLGISLGYAKTLTKVDNTELSECDALVEGGKTVVVFLRDSLPLGAIALSDTVKKDAKEGIAALRAMGLYTVLLTGDNRKVARVVGNEVGVDEIIAEVLPADKEKKVRELSSRGKVCMVGDGINDAPALARADLGIAIGRGTDIAIDSADVVLTHGGILDVASAISIGRKTLLNIKENLFWAFLYNCIGIPLAAGVFFVSLPPMFGAFAMSLSSFSVVMNALRLNLWRPKFKKENKTMEIKRSYSVKGMMCPHCEARVKTALEAVPGIISATPSHKKKSVTVILASDIDDAIIVKAITDAGYQVI